MAVVVEAERLIDADRVTEALRRFVFTPDERPVELMGGAGAPVLRTSGGRYSMLPTDWLIRQDPVVDDAVLVLAERGRHAVVCYGVLLARDGTPYLLNDVDTMRTFGRYLGQGLHPVAFAQVLAALHGGQPGDRPVAYPSTTGDLSLDPPPAQRREGTVLVIEFRSTIRQMDPDDGPVVETLAWRVEAAPDQPARWERQVLDRVPEE